MRLRRIFCDEKDLVIYELSRFDQQFISSILYKNYVPINISDIDSACDLNEGDKITAIGFPDESYVSVLPMDDRERGWNSNRLVVPSVTYGTIALNTKSNFYFDANIFVYHGFSGGPIIRNNKLIGIVHGADFNYPVLKNGPGIVYQNFYSRHIKSSEIFKMYKDLKKKVAAITGPWR